MNEQVAMAFKYLREGLSDLQSKALGDLEAIRVGLVECSDAVEALEEVVLPLVSERH